MLKDKVTMLIFSCDKFSDLWDAHVQQLEKYWNNRNIDTYIVTDKENTRTFDNVAVISAGADKEFSERLEYALTFVKTEYVFVTLDDYFLIKTVYNEKIDNLIEIMTKEKLDYMRLFKNPKKATQEQFKDYKGIYSVDTNRRYSVNLYAGIWRKEFMAKTVQDVKNPWQFEVSLYKVAQKNNAKCAMSKKKEFVILDVVRKGKILNKANCYLRRHGIYNGSREVQSIWYEIKLAIRTFGARHAPEKIVNLARNFMIKRGNHYFSQDE